MYICITILTLEIFYKKIYGVCRLDG